MTWAIASPPPGWERLPWRQGSKQKLSIYVDDGVNTDPDLIIGFFMSADVAEHAVTTHNMLIRTGSGEQVD